MHMNGYYIKQTINNLHKFKFYSDINFVTINVIIQNLLTFVF